MQSSVVLAFCVVVAACVLASSDCAPQFLGIGGIFNGTEAQKYWSTRYPSNHLKNVASVQRVAAEKKRQHAKQVANRTPEQPQTVSFQTQAGNLGPAAAPQDDDANDVGQETLFRQKAPKFVEAVDDDQDNNVKRH